MELLIKKITMLITIIIIGVLLTIASSFSKAIMDLSEDKKLKFKNEFFWLKAYSWKNKWKLDDKSNPIRVNGKYVEKFFGSSRWFVMFTDAWHLFGFFYNRANKAVGVCIGILSAKYSWWFLVGYIVTSILYAGIFHLFYNSKLLKK